MPAHRGNWTALGGLLRRPLGFGQVFKSTAHCDSRALTGSADARLRYRRRRYSLNSPNQDDGQLFDDFAVFHKEQVSNLTVGINLASGTGRFYYENELLRSRAPRNCGT
jgi:hypothetical protein